MEKTIVKKQQITAEELKLLLPIVESYNFNCLRTIQEYKVAIEQFTNQEIDIQLIENLKQFSNSVDEDDMRLIMQNCL